MLLFKKVAWLIIDVALKNFNSLNYLLVIIIILYYVDHFSLVSVKTRSFHEVHPPSFESCYPRLPVEGCLHGGALSLCIGGKGLISNPESFSTFHGVVRNSQMHC